MKDMGVTDKKTAGLLSPLVHILLIILLSLLAYSNTFHVPFHFDDNNAIVENPFIKDLRFFIEPSKAEGFKGPFGYNAFKSRYIGFLSFALNYRLHGFGVTGYHIVNILIHIGNALLLYLFIMLTFKTPFLQNSGFKNYSRHIALFTALVFACHPIQTQAVTYIYQRITALSTMFYLLSLVMYIKARLPSTSASTLTCYFVSLISAVLAMKTKEIAFTLPMVITLYEFMFFQGRLKRRLLYLIPLILTVLIIPLTLVDIGKPIEELIGDAGEITRGAKHMSRWEYMITELRVVVTYIRLIFIPVNQNLDYDYPRYQSFFNIEILLSFLFLLFIFGFSVYLFYSYRRRVTHIRFITFGIIWFFINLVLESSIPLNNVIFEHRMYLPSAGLFLALITSVFIAAEKLKVRRGGMDWAVIFVLAVITLVLAEASYARNSVWKDKLTMWSDVVKKSPNKARGNNNLGFVYQSRGLLDEAIKHYQIAIKNYPDYLKSHINLGSAYQAKGLIYRAIEQYEIAVKLNPDYPEAHNNLGFAYQIKGLIDRAIEHYQIAIKLNPNYPEAHINLGNAYQIKGLIDRAMEHYQIAIKLNPNYPDPHINLGNVYQSRGLIDYSISHYKVAIRLNPNIPEAHNNLGAAYQAKGLIDDAIIHYEVALRLNPNYMKAHNNLGTAYRAKGMITRAKEHFDAAKRLKNARDIQN